MALHHSPSTVTSGLALCLDPANKKSYSQNEYQWSTDIFSNLGGGPGTNCTLSRDTITSPVGTTPMKMVTTGSDPYTQNTPLIPAALGQVWFVSVYVKANVSTTCQIFIFNANTSGSTMVNGNWVGIAAATFSVTTEWQRISLSIVPYDATTGYVLCRLDGPDTYVAGTTLWWDGLQIERAPTGTSAPTPFTPIYNGGAVYNDLSGNSRGASLVSFPNYSTDGGGSMLFNSTGRYISLAQNSYGITDAYTVSFWVKRIGGTGIFLYIGVAPGSTSGMYFESYFPLDLVTWYFGPNSPQAVNYTGLLSLTSWTNVAMTMVTSTKTHTLYINGTQVGSTVLTNAVTAPSASSGWRMVDGSQTWTGSIGNLCIYNRVLTAAEIRQNFNALRGRYGI
jgi:hypothetical protein